MKEARTSKRGIRQVTGMPHYGSMFFGSIIWWPKTVGHTIHSLHVPSRFLLMDLYAMFHRLWYYRGYFLEENMLHSVYRQATQTLRDSLTHCTWTGYGALLIAWTLSCFQIPSWTLFWWDTPQFTVTVKYNFL